MVRNKIQHSRITSKTPLELSKISPSSENEGDKEHKNYIICQRLRPVLLSAKGGTATVLAYAF